MRVVLMVCAMVACAGSSVTDKVRVVSTKGNLKLLKNAIVFLRDNSGRLPSVEEGLGVLIHEPVDWPQGIPWEPLLQTTELPTDGWGNAFVYVLDANLPDGFGIYSCGRDGVTSSNGNDPDDLNTQNLNVRVAAYDQKPPGRGWARAIFVYLLMLGGIILILWETSRIEKHLKRRRAVSS